MGPGASRETVYADVVTHHLEPVPFEPGDRPDRGWTDDLDEDRPLVRPTWWRWVAIAVIVAMVVAGPFAYAIYRLLT